MLAWNENNEPNSAIECCEYFSLERIRAWLVWLIKGLRI